MNQKEMVSHDGVTITYACSQIDPEKPWLTFIIPFGLRLELAWPFFQTFQEHYNVLSWESRLILSPPSRVIEEGELTVKNHTLDLMALLDTLGAEQSILVGYCSGAGIALSALNTDADRFSKLVLVNGEYVLFNDPKCITQYGGDVDNLFPIASMSIDKASYILEKINLNQEDAQSNLPEGVYLPFSEPHYFYRYANNYLSYRTLDYEALAKNVEIETLIIAGECDQQTNVYSAQKIRRQITDSEMHIEPYGDHYGVLRVNSRTLQYIENYLEKELCYA